MAAISIALNGYHKQDFSSMSKSRGTGSSRGRGGAGAIHRGEGALWIDGPGGNRYALPAFR